MDTESKAHAEAVEGPQLAESLQGLMDSLTLKVAENGYPVPTDALVEVLRTGRSPDGVYEIRIPYERAVQDATTWLVATKAVIDSLRQPDVAG